MWHVAMNKVQQSNEHSDETKNLRLSYIKCETHVGCPSNVKKSIMRHI